MIRIEKPITLLRIIEEKQTTKCYLFSIEGDHELLMAQTWVMQLEKFFEAMRCSKSHNGNIATYMLKVEVEYWQYGAIRHLKS